MREGGKGGGSDTPFAVTPSTSPGIEFHHAVMSQVSSYLPLLMILLLHVACVYLIRTLKKQKPCTKV